MSDDTQDDAPTTVRVRVLREQEANKDKDRQYLASGTEVDLPIDWALELLTRGEEAEAITADGALVGKKALAAITKR